MWKSWRNKKLCPDSRKYYNNKVNVLLIIFTLIFFTSCNQYSFDEDAREGEYEADPSLGLNAPGEFALQVNAEMTLNMENGKLNAMLGNPAKNTRDCRVTLILDETKETLYESEILCPGEREAYIAVNTAMFGEEKTDSYPATAIFEVIDPDTAEVIGQIQAGVIIYLV